MNKIVIITGPTAVGKTKCGLKIAEAFNTDIINGDAFQIYKHMDIGTAKPTISELKMIKHHLIDIQEPSEEFNVYKYQNLVRNLIIEMLENHKLPLIVGGSSLYLESIFLDYKFNEEKKNNQFEEKYNHLSNEELHELLKSKDLDLANNIHPNNRKRILRYLEKIENGLEFDNHKSDKIYDALVIYLNDDRDILYQRINQRVDQMMEDGLLDEVRKLDRTTISKTAKQAIGYKELFMYLDGKYSLEEAVDKIKQSSRNYAKRQMTWFRNKDYIKEIMINPNDFNSTIEEIKSLIDNFIK